MAKHDLNLTPSILGHPAELEWPGEDDTPDLRSRALHPPDLQAQWNIVTRPGTTRAARNTTFLRLTVLSSSVLPRRGVALIDTYDEVSIGRDRCETPRLRLKELAVSKYHASIYWDSGEKLWSIVDMGSTHGTNLVSSELPEAQIPGSIFIHGHNLTKSTRLSPPKISSLPRPLSHLQRIIIAGTTLAVHIHPDQAPCDACNITENNLINLETSNAKTGTVARIAGCNEPKPNGTKSLKDLRRSLLSHSPYSVSIQHQAPTLPSSGSYLDRAELRRQRFPGWRDDRREITPCRGTPDRSCHSRAYHGPPSTGSTSNQHLETASPIPLTNVGHRLLAKQGWRPGSTLGAQSEDKVTANALIEPLMLQGTSNRRGLGMKRK